MTAADTFFPAPATAAAIPFLQRVRVENFKSIGKCDVQLQRLTLLVGRNGAGKSNFLDALRFVVDGLQTSLEHAIKSRGGIQMVRRRSTGHPHNLAIGLEFNLPDHSSGTYSFVIAARKDGGFSVKRESLKIIAPHHSPLFYTAEEGAIVSSNPATLPRGAADRLYLVLASGVEAFRPAYDALSSMGFYNLNPEAMKELQSPDAGELLHRDGDNIASVVARLQAEAPGEKERAESYLQKIVGDVAGVDRVQFGPRETLEFRQLVLGSQHPWKFPAANMSDGTLRALGILIAVSQLAHVRGRVRLVGIEEPETALHPSAAHALMDALTEARESTQVLITTHSADLLDRVDLDITGLLAVQSVAGTTQIAPIDGASLEAIRTHLYSAGEMLRMDQFEPDANDVRRQLQLPMFDHFSDRPGDAQ